MYKIRLAGCYDSETLFGKLIRWKQRLMGMSDKYNRYSHTEIHIPYYKEFENKISKLNNTMNNESLIIGDKNIKRNMYKENGIWFSSCETDNGCRFKSIEDKGGSWDYIDIPVTFSQMGKIINFMKRNNGNGYGKVQIITSVLLQKNFKKEGTFFCSEICSQILQLIHASDELCLLDSKFVHPGHLMNVMDTDEHFIY